MNKVSIHSLAKIFNPAHTYRYIYDTSNQRYDCKFNASLVFTKMVTGLNPDRVGLVSEFGSMSFESVKDVYISDEIVGIGYKMDIICGDGKDEITHKLLVDKQYY